MKWYKFVMRTDSYSKGYLIADSKDPYKPATKKGLYLWNKKAKGLAYFEPNYSYILDSKSPLNFIPAEFFTH